MSARRPGAEPDAGPVHHTGVEELLYDQPQDVPATRVDPVGTLCESVAGQV